VAERPGASGWRLEGGPRPGGGAELKLVEGSRTLGAVPLRASRQSLRVTLIFDHATRPGLRPRGPAIAVGVPSRDAELSLRATRSSGARFDLAALRLEG
jgi:hypothetical protein